MSEQDNGKHPWPKIVIPADKFEELWAPWRRALIIKVLGCEIIDLEHGYAVVPFYSREDYYHVLEEGPWLIMSHYLTVVPWIRFWPSSDKITSNVIWVRFPELLVEFFDEDLLLKMACKIGKAVKIYNITMGVVRGKYAMVCVQINLNKPLIPYIGLLGYLQRVEYEGLHIIYFECGGYGRRKESCPTVIISTEVSSTQKPQGQPSLTTSNVWRPALEKEGLYRPWMLPKSFRRYRQTAGRQGGTRPEVGGKNQMQGEKDITTVHDVQSLVQ